MPWHGLGGALLLPGHTWAWWNPTSHRAPSTNSRKQNNVVARVVGEEGPLLRLNVPCGRPGTAERDDSSGEGAHLNGTHPHLQTTAALMLFKKPWGKSYC